MPATLRKLMWLEEPRVGTQEAWALALWAACSLGVHFCLSRGRRFIQPDFLGSPCRGAGFYLTVSFEGTASRSGSSREPQTVASPQGPLAEPWLTLQESSLPALCGEGSVCCFLSWKEGGI